MLQVVVHEPGGKRSLTGLCAGYELGDWRANTFADHLIESLPDFCLTYSEYSEMDHGSAVRLLRQAAQLVYKTDKFKNRGEFGELMLHVILKSQVQTLPAVSKIFYKDALNDTVKGFDAVHVVPIYDGLELWLGEVKFYDDVARAIRDVVEELEKHLKADYLRGEFLAITNKLDSAWPHVDKLRLLLDKNTSLDQVFKAFCIPVLLTYDSDVTGKHVSSAGAYLLELEAELREIGKRFAGKTEDIEHRIHLFLVPLKTKERLIKRLDEKLKIWQQI
ncbi:hypothetical protein FHT12_002460 [Xanthomonas campestris]|uniref:HamA C-terminal domain-containing protein n=1 Tax=Xanthomonas euroxanthea TaxID=2259622 RepID=UPI000CEDD332|nr:DUF1837 domain-containing protein [Xanthomonas euroxanthea]NIJ93763.1 hypothetical protein [Xanthomonas euroxanthea]PPT26191.1 hypothetical protein XaCFBP7622_18370 [Xanthomonas arboricola]